MLLVESFAVRGSDELLLWKQLLLHVLKRAHDFLAGGASVTRALRAEAPEFKPQAERTVDYLLQTLLTRHDQCILFWTTTGASSSNFFNLASSSLEVPRRRRDQVEQRADILSCYQQL